MGVRRAVNPYRLVPVGFVLVICLGAALLSLPAATVPGRDTGFVDALFTAVSATCVTGLITVDTASQWTAFGKVVILALIQIGGFGIMTLATLLVLLVRRRVGLQATLTTRVEGRTSLGRIRSMPARIAATMLMIELVLATVLSIRFKIAYDDGWGSAVWHGVFHAISAFNNAGFALYSNNVMGFVTDWWIIIPLCVGVVAGGMGFPVFFELAGRRFLRPRDWSVHARLTVWGTVLLLVLGFVAFAMVEWRNHLTIGELDPAGKVLASIAGSVFPRTAGFNSIDYGLVRPETLGVHYLLMFIGGGSAGTAGGIKVGTFLLLAFVIVSEVRGEPEVLIGHRRIDAGIQRQALTVVLLGVGLVAIGTFIILSRTHFGLDVVLFEAISAFGTVGLSANLTPLLPTSAKIVLMVLMFCGRVGTITVASAMALSKRRHRFGLPTERPIVG